jgi:N-acyl amino acid synthase of PEP-CTERM/exosortase system
VVILRSIILNKKLSASHTIEDISQKIAAMKINDQVDVIDKHFSQFLSPEMANTPALKDEVFKIRHAVYCDELAFESVKENGKEQDEFDQQSSFALIRHKPTNTFTSCVRVVTSDKSKSLLPIEKYCSNALKNSQFHPNNFARETIAEISRLAVKSDFRRRKNDKFKGSAFAALSETTYSEAELRCFPFMAIGLYMSAASIAIDSGIEHAYVMMEPKLARSMKFIGIKFIQIGEPIEYHGLRVPYYINSQMFLDNLSPSFTYLYNSIRVNLLNTRA